MRVRALDFLDRAAVGSGVPNPLTSAHPKRIQQGRTSAGTLIRRSIAVLALLVVNLTVLVGPGAQPAHADVASLSENFDSVTAPALPPGWTSTVVTGQSTDKPWKTGTPPVTTYPLAASAAAASHATDINLTSPTFVPGAGSTLLFQHQQWLQDRHDGGVLEIKIGTGSFVDFLAAGGRFTQDGYDNTMFTGALSGRSAWTGQISSNGGAPATYFTQATLPASAIGKSTQLRWRLVTDSSLGDGGFFRVDSVRVSRPDITVTIDQAAGQADPTSASTINYTAVFSAPVTGFTGTDVTIGGTAPGTKTATVTGGPSTYNVAVSGMTGSGTVVPTLGTDVVNELNNRSTSTDNTVTYNAPASVTINQAASQVDPTNASPITFTARFSTAVTGFTGADVAIGGTAPGIATSTVTVTGGPSTYIVAVTGMTGPGTVVASIPANVVTGGNTASTSTDNTVAYDNVAPTVTINQAATQTDPASAPPISFTAAFSEPVTGFIGADVSIGGTAPGTRTATVTGGPAVYTVVVTGVTAPGTVTASIPAGRATDLAGNLSAASTSTDNSVTSTFNTVTINQAAGQADPTKASPVTFTATFGAAVTGFTGSDVTIGGTAPGTKTATVTGGPAVYTVTVTGMTGSGTVLASIPANVVTGGNTASTSTDNTVTYDNVAPTVTINQAATQADPATTTPVAFTAVFSEPVTGFTGSDVAIGGTTGGTKTATVTGGPRTYTVTVSGMTGSGTVVASIPAGRATDLAGNPSAASTSTDNSVSGTFRTVTINQATGQADPTKAAPITFTATFSAAVTGFTSADVTIGGTAPGTKTATVTGGPLTFTVAVTGMTGSGTVVASIPGNVVTEGNAASTSTDNSVTYDTVAPTVIINQAATQADPATTAPVTFTASFSEPVTGFTGSDVAIAGTAPGTKSVTVTGGPSTYTVTVSGMTASGTVVASIPAGRATDLAGNLSAASTSTDNTVAYTFNPPRTVTIKQGASQVDPTNATSIRFDVVFSAAVTGLTSSDITVGGTAPGAKTVSLSGGPSAYAVTVSGMTGPGTVVASIPANVVVEGNTASTSTDNSVTYDNVKPTVTINQAATQADPTTTAPIAFTVVWSEPVTNFAGYHVNVAGTAQGTKTVALTGGPMTYTATVTGMTSSGTVVVSISGDRVLDAAGNLNTASTSTDNSVQLNLRTVTINKATTQAKTTNKSPITFDVLFGSAASGFTGADVTVGGTAPGTKTVAVTGGPAAYTVAISGMTGDGTVIPSIGANVVDGGNHASTSTDNLVIYDTTGPTVTINQAATQVDPAATGPIQFTVTFASAVTGFSAADVVVAGTAPGTKTVVVTGTRYQYTVNVSGMTGPGTVVASIPAGGAADSIGNPNLASTSTDNTVTYSP